MFSKTFAIFLAGVFLIRYIQDIERCLCSRESHTTYRLPQRLIRFDSKNIAFDIKRHI